MRHLIFTWALLRLIWQSKGYNMKEIPGWLKARWPDRAGLGLSSVQAKAQRGKRAPRDVAKFLLGDELPTREGYEKPAKVVRLGLAALSGLPSPTIAGRLDSLSSQLDSAQAKLDAKLDINGAKLDSHTAKLDTHGGKLDALDSKLEKANAVLAEISAQQKSGRHLNGTVLGILLILGLLLAGRLMRSDTGRAESAVQAFLRVSLGNLLNLGKKDEEYWIPKEPYSWQKLAKDCDAAAGEEAINGACWVWIAAVKPPCGKLIRHGDKCYRPVAADPGKPVGLVQTAPGQP